MNTRTRERAATGQAVTVTLPADVVARLLARTPVGVLATPDARLLNDVQWLVQDTFDSHERGGV